MDRRERYLEERNAKNELSYEALEEAYYPVEMRMLDKQKTIEDIVINDFMVEKMFEALSELPDKEKWVIEQIYINGKSVVELAKETGQTRTTVQSRKTRALKKIKQLMIEKYNV
jgi:RNA polymerase sigma factor (sigma-70 family)